MAKGEKPATIKSIQRAGRILSAFSISDPRLSLNQLTSHLGSTKATAHRYTMALREANLIRYSERDSLFSLGPEILTLSSVARAGMPIISVAEPHISELMGELNQTLVLSIWDGGTAVVVYVDDQVDNVIQVSVRTGARLELANSAQGRVFCAYLDPNVEPFVKEALAESAELRDDVERIRDDGYAANSIKSSGVRSIAVPIMSRSEKISGSLAIIGTTNALPEGCEFGIAEKLSASAIRISRQMPPNIED